MLCTEWVIMETAQSLTGTRCSPLMRRKRNELQRPSHFWCKWTEILSSISYVPTWLHSFGWLQGAEGWSVIGGGKLGGKQSYRSHPPQEIPLKNTFNILDLQDFPRLACQRTVSGLSTGGGVQLHSLLFTTLSRKLVQHGPRFSSRGTALSQNQWAQHSPLKMLIIGDSIIRDIKLKLAKTFTQTRFH